MRRIWVNIQDQQRTVHLSVRSDDWEVVLGALSADPETIAELEQAMERFRQGHAEMPSAWGAESELRPGLFWEGDEPKALVDLTARFIAVDERLPCPTSTDYVELPSRGGEETRPIAIGYELSAEWEFAATLEGWFEKSRTRREERTARLQVDSRAVIYGEVVAFLVRRLDDLDSAKPDSAKTDSADADSTDSGLISKLHSEWLITERADLGGRSPRDEMLRDIDRIEHDIESRSRQWTIFGECPPGVASSSFAYRFGPWGRHEVIVNYDMIRYLLQSMIEDRERNARIPFEKRLARYTEKRLRWMGESREEYGGRSAFEVIDLERQRIPASAGPDEACIDPDCPLCRMMADQSMGPTFWFLDGCHMDMEFAFSFCPTLDQWKAEYGEYVEGGSGSTEVFEPVGRFPVTLPTAEIWKNSHLNEDILASLEPGQRLYLILFSVGGNLAELAEDARNDAEILPTMMELLTRFDNLRGALRDHVGWLSRSLIQHCCEDLQAMASLRPALADKCLDLERKLQWLEELADRVSGTLDLSP